MNQGSSLHWLFIVAIFNISKEYVLHTTAILGIQQQLFENDTNVHVSKRGTVRQE
jgi:hypothetical protein